MIAPFSLARQAPHLLRREPVITLVGLLFLAVIGPTLVGLALDDRRIAGVSVWLKPFKFQLSFAVHILTVALALSALDRSSRTGVATRAAVAILLVMSLFEVGWITVQGARGLPSHFAVRPFDAMMYGLMGIGAILIVLATASLGVLILRCPASGVPNVLSRAVGAGLLISGLTGLVTGLAISFHGGHGVGGSPGVGATLPLLGWSGLHGDLRVPHFVGLHAAQMLPLLGIVLVSTPSLLAKRVLLVASLLISGVTLALLLQALAGHPFIPLT